MSVAIGFPIDLLYPPHVFTPEEKDIWSNKLDVSPHKQNDGFLPHEEHDDSCRIECSDEDKSKLGTPKKRELVPFCGAPEATNDFNFAEHADENRCMALCHNSSILGLNENHAQSDDEESVTGTQTMSIVPEYVSRIIFDNQIMACYQGGGPDLSRFAIETFSNLWISHSIPWVDVFLHVHIENVDQMCSFVVEEIVDERSIVDIMDRFALDDWKTLLFSALTNKHMQANVLFTLGGILNRQVMLLDVPSKIKETFTKETMNKNFMKVFCQSLMPPFDENFLYAFKPDILENHFK